MVISNCLLLFRFSWLRSFFAGFLRFITNWCCSAHTFILTHSLTHVHTHTETHTYTLTHSPESFSHGACTQPMHRVFRYAHTSFYNTRAPRTENRYPFILCYPWRNKIHHKRDVTFVFSINSYISILYWVGKVFDRTWCICIGVVQFSCISTMPLLGKHCYRQSRNYLYRHKFPRFQQKNIV